MPEPSTIKAGVPPVTCCQPVPVLNATWELLEPYQLESRPACCASVVATTQYLVPLMRRVGVFGSLATAKPHGAAGTVATAETSGVPGPMGQQASVYMLRVTVFVGQSLGSRRMIAAEICSGTPVAEAINVPASHCVVPGTKQLSGPITGVTAAIGIVAGGTRVRNQIAAKDDCGSKGVFGGMLLKGMLRASGAVRDPFRFAPKTNCGSSANTAPQARIPRRAPPILPPTHTPIASIYRTAERFVKLNPLAEILRVVRTRMVAVSLVLGIVGCEKNGEAVVTGRITSQL